LSCYKSLELKKFVGEILDSIKTIRTTQEHVNKYDKIIYLTINNVITQYIFKNSGGTIL